MRRRRSLRPAVIGGALDEVLGVGEPPLFDEQVHPARDRSSAEGRVRRDGGPGRVRLPGPSARLLADAQQVGGPVRAGAPGQQGRQVASGRGVPAGPHGVVDPRHGVPVSAHVPPSPAAPAQSPDDDRRQDDRRPSTPAPPHRPSLSVPVLRLIEPRAGHYDEIHAVGSIREGLPAIRDLTSLPDSRSPFLMILASLLSRVRSRASPDLRITARTGSAPSRSWACRRGAGRSRACSRSRRWSCASGSSTRTNCWA